MPTITRVLVIASYVLFGLLVISFILILSFREYITRSIFGVRAAQVGPLVEDAQKAADHITDRLAGHLLRDAPLDVRQGVRAILPRLANFLLWARLRNWWWQWLLGIFVSIGGLAGTVLLMNQNELLNNQNTLIERQMNLEEANRRSTLVVLMSNIMDKVDREIAEQQIERKLTRSARDTAYYSLSQSLIGQIAALSHSFKPYRYMNEDTLILKALSPERGQLLITLSRLPLDTNTLYKIYEKSTFVQAELIGAMLGSANLSWADLVEADLRGAHLIRANLVEANLRGANLSGATLIGADLRRADLSRADFFWAELRGANLSRAYLVEADLRGANLSGANLIGAYLRRADLSGADFFKADLSGANLKGANLVEADLSGANLSGANLNFNQITQAKSLYNCEGLDDSLRMKIERIHPHVFKNIPD
jgi:uncharacterized protein YjbI with pentapeptide repeats